MKYGIIVLVCGLLVACKQKDEVLHIADFIKGEMNVTETRKYQHIGDTSETTVYLKQQNTLINGSTWQFSTMWLNADSLPINAGVERYDEQNRVQMVKQSYFEQIGPDRVLEIKGELDSTLISNLLNKSQTFKITFHPIVDSTVTMLIQADVRANFITQNTSTGATETLLEIVSKEATTIDFEDARRDTTLLTSTRKVFSKSKGLIYFDVESNNEKSTFKLVE